MKNVPIAYTNSQRQAIDLIESKIKECVTLAEANQVEFLGFCTSLDHDEDSAGSVNASARFMAGVIQGLFNAKPEIAQALEEMNEGEQ